ncbi:MAG: hypothetical protein GY940_37515 [bacterium]|nr:hypothetical protein [bacterium]
MDKTFLIITHIKEAKADGGQERRPLYFFFGCTFVCTVNVSPTTGGGASISLTLLSTTQVTLMTGRPSHYLLPQFITFNYFCHLG